MNRRIETALQQIQLPKAVEFENLFSKKKKE
jgi:hypothetical protein